MTFSDDVARWLAAFGIRATSVAAVFRSPESAMLHVRLRSGVVVSGRDPVIHGPEA